LFTAFAYQMSSDMVIFRYGHLQIWPSSDMVIFHNFHYALFYQIYSDKEF